MSNIKKITFSDRKAELIGKLTDAAIGVSQLEQQLDAQNAVLANLKAEYNAILAFEAREDDYQ